MFGSLVFFNIWAYIMIELKCFIKKKFLTKSK